MTPVQYIFYCLNQIRWALYRLTPKGREAWKFKKAYGQLLRKHKLRRSAKMRVVHSANDHLKTRKILAFFKGKSISKPKKSNHQVMDVVKKKHGEELKAKGVKIQQNGTFKNE